MPARCSAAVAAAGLLGTGADGLGDLIGPPDLEELLGPGTSAGTPDDGGASKRPAPAPVAGGRLITPPATGTTNGATR